MKLLILSLFLLSLSFCVGASRETRIPVAFIDTGVSTGLETYFCRDGLSASGNNGIYSASGTDFNDRNGHGSNIESIITDPAYFDSSKFCLRSYKMGDKKVSAFIFAKLINLAIDHKAKIINISLSSSPGSTSSISEFLALKRALDAGISVVVAAGNDGALLKEEDCSIFPACYSLSLKQYPNYYVIGNYGSSHTNFGLDVVTYFEYGNNVGNPVKSGTSQATATFTKKLVRKIGER